MGNHKSKAYTGVQPGTEVTKKMKEEIDQQNKKAKESENDFFVVVTKSINDTYDTGKDIVKTLHDDVKDITQETINTLQLPLTVGVGIAVFLLLSKR